MKGEDQRQTQSLFAAKSTKYSDEKHTYIKTERISNHIVVMHQRFVQLWDALIDQFLNFIYKFYYQFRRAFRLKNHYVKDMFCLYQGLL
ncbi:hypothetical protein T06_10141 [Trichinella sp. T6]|nr:hypothetical protein T06_10141 [Trichinella sp. T6]